MEKILLSKNKVGKNYSSHFFNSVLFLGILLITFTSQSQNVNVTRIITDFGGYWSSSAPLSANNAIRPNNRHNLLAFESNAVIYSTGANNAILDANGVNYVNSDFRVLPLAVLPGSTSGASNFLIVGNAIDGNPATSVFNAPSVVNLKTTDVLTDGIKGLDLGTGVTNITANITISFPIECIKETSLTDNEPEFIITQIADPSSTYDQFLFVDSSGNTVGSLYTANFGAVTTTTHVLGTQRIDLFTLQANVPYATAPTIGNGSAGSGERTIRILALKFSDFGINAGNYSNIAALRWVTKGTSDPAFIAYNYNSIKKGDSTETVWRGDTNTDWNTASNWSCNNLPTTTINATIPNSVSSNNYPVLSSAGSVRNLTIEGGASVEITGDLAIAGTITNLGTLDAQAGGLEFVGTSAQIIDEDLLVNNSIKDLTINNTNGVTLEGDLDLTGILRLDTGSFETGGFLTFKSNASTTAMVAPITSGSISGEVTVERYIPARRAFRFLSSSVDGGTIRSNWQENGAEIVGLGTDITGGGGTTNGFDVSTSNNPSLFSFSNATEAWVTEQNTNVNQFAGIPYRILVRGDRTIDLTNNATTPTNTTLRAKGILKTGNVTVTDFNPLADKFNFIGNPYQAPVDMEQVLSTSTSLNQNFYYVWDPTINTRGGYVTVDVINNTNTILGSVADRNLQPGQAAFVYTTEDGTPSMTFTENDKIVSTTTTDMFRSNTSINSSAAQMRFTLYDNNALTNNLPASDGFVILLDPTYSNSVDEFDAKKITNQDETIAMLIDGVSLSYQSRNMPIVGETIPLAHTQYRFTNYTYRAEISGISDVTPFLFDNFNNSYSELNSNGTTLVPFTVNPAIAGSIASDRFSIVFNQILNTNETAFNNSIAVYPNPISSNQINISVPETGDYQVTILTLYGQKLLSANLSTESNKTLHIETNNKLASGIYFIQISYGEFLSTKKIIVK